MRKKYLSALLFGALLVTSAGTFTSCKDYDDEINNLQEQVDKLATKEDMEAKLSQMQAAIDAAKATAEDALAKAEAAGDTEEIASLKNRIQALEDAAIDVEALKNEIKTAVDGQLSTFRTEIQELLDKMEKELGLTVADMVTSVELVLSYNAEQQDGAPEVEFTTVVEKENVFGKDLTNAITFVKDRQVQVGGDFIVRVSPTNAVLTPEMISFVNSKGENLDEFVKVTKVQKYDELLSASRSSNNNGLWKVTTELVKYNEDEFTKVTTTGENNDKKVLFAVRVNNTPSAAENREVVSTYDLSFAWTEFTPAEQLFYYVDDTKITDIQNRYGLVAQLIENKWKTDAAVKPTDDNVEADADDDRAPSEPAQADDPILFPAVQGQEITISLTSAEDKSAMESEEKLVAPSSKIKGMYVVLDKDYAYESAPSEINAWNSYTYTGLNTVVEGTSTKISINSDKAIDDIIGFRVFAVNHDGTLVDPDGKAFYVKVGSEGVVWNAANAVLTPESTTDKTTDAKAISLAKVKDAAKFIWKTDKVNNSENAFTVKFLNEGGDEIFASNYTDEQVCQYVTETRIESVKKFEIVATEALYNYEDGKTYNGKLEVVNSEGFVIATLNASFTKELPTAMPEGFSVKTAQVKDGIYNCYLQPNSWVGTNGDDAATEGTMDMSHVFNFGSGTLDNYIVSFANSDKDKDGKLISATASGAAPLSIDRDFIDNKTEHATTIAYNYGQITSQKENGQYIDYKITSDVTFNTIYNCIYNDTYTWHWKTREECGGIYLEKNEDGTWKNPLPYTTELTYGTDKPYTNYGGWIIGVSSQDGKYNADLGTPYTHLGARKPTLLVKEAHLISNNNKEIDEYFTVTVTDGKITGFVATQTSDQTNPTANVESTLAVTCYDMYGHKIVVEVPMTVVRR